MIENNYPESVEDDELDEHSVAVLAMACRFPGAADVAQYWQNLRGGVESISFFSEEELLAAGLEPAMVRHPHFVKAHPSIEGVELFDAAFFDMPPREAEILDPQSRLFLECSWQALELAGYVADDYDGWIGVFAGTSSSTYLTSNLQTRGDLYASQGWFPIYLANDRDYFTTRVSYKLNLRGPSMNIQTACSTSLVAVHQACQSLLDYQCTLALAGGVRVTVPQVGGYMYEPGGITSPDGHCRSFDAGGNGSLFGSGVGVVVLKRLADAIADGDPIEAVIRGSAVNNDGWAKVGFTAPSVDGQAEVIAMAQAAAEVDPETISYIETHGSATALGDPIEAAALTDAFRSATDKTGFCALGSVKSNFGHLEAAAGVAGLIKTVLALKHRELPPSLHFEKPNPEIDFESTPFYVNAALRDWPANGGPRRAGVSSFGMGGTNVHAILEEAPVPAPSGPSRRHHLLMLSARTPTALEAATEGLAAHLAEDAEIADVAYTLHLGRRAFEHRRVLICQGREDATMVLGGGDPERLMSAVPSATGRGVAFLFPGLGEHYVDMGLGLYQDEEVFRYEIDRCADLLAPHLGTDLREVLYPRGIRAVPVESGRGMGIDLARMLGRGPEELDENARRLRQTRFAQPAVFVVEYALARLWMSWGLEPQALLGHSLGEYVAATIAGVFRLGDALALVAERARLIDDLPGGAMLAISLAEDRIVPLLGDDVSLSAVNGPEVTVVAGSEAAVGALRERLEGEDVVCHRLPTSHAFHSSMMEPAAETLTARLREIELEAPAVPLISNVTGTWLTADEARDPAYWARHLCQTVRFADGAAELLRDADRVLLEVGPGHGLGALVMQSSKETSTVISTLRSSFDRRDDQSFALGALGRLWLAGVRVDGAKLYAGETRRRLHLPTYPFERRRYWIEAASAAITGAAGCAGINSHATFESAEEPRPSENTKVARDFNPARPVAPAMPTLEIHGRPHLPTPYVEPEGELETRIAAIWQEILGIAPIGLHDSYFDMGGHSLMAPRVVQRLEQDLDICLPLQTFLEHPTVSKLAAVIERSRAEGAKVLAAAAVDLEAEAHLPAAIHPAAKVARQPPSAVLVTGGTGFFGAHLLAELAVATDARLFCLARADDADAARDRLRRNLEHQRVWYDELDARIEPLAGDLAKPCLGLSEERFAILAEELDAVYHAGAWVNFTYPYSVLKDSNVTGTLEALRLAATTKTKPFHFISSTAVFTPASFAAEGLAMEDDALDHTAGLFCGYAETKWVCEKILRLAGERGLPVGVYRPGVISGHSHTGVGNTSDMVWNLIKGSIQLQATIDIFKLLDVTPVDYVARAIVRLSLGENWAGRAFQFATPQPMPWDEVFDVIRDMGYPIRRLSGEEWGREFQRAAREGVENAMLPFLPVFEGEASAEGAVAPAEAQGERPPQGRYDDRNTLAVLDRDVRCPPVDADLVRTYMSYFIESGFLDPPQVSG